MHNLKHDTRIDVHCKNRDLNRSKKVSVDLQRITNFVVNSSRSVWRIKLNSLSGTCFVKNMSQSKKTHPNWWTPTDAIASHVLKKLIREKIMKVVAFFKAAWNYDCNKCLSEETFFTLHLWMGRNKTKYAVQHIIRILSSWRIWI